MTRLTQLMTATAVAALCAGSASAQTLTAGLSAAPSSMDPHFATTGQNQQLAMNLYDRLVHIDAAGNFTPGLATEWEVSEDRLTWTFTLREGVTFTNGSPFTAHDVVYTFERIPEVPNSPAPFTQRLAAISSVEAVDDQTLVVTTAEPAPVLISDLATIYIVSRDAGDAESADFDRGTAALGTGPYRMVSYSPGEQLVIARNDDYWGETAAFEEITIRFLDNAATRVASLQAGEVDFIDAVPPNDLQRLSADDGIDVISAPSARMLYMGVDQLEDTTVQIDPAVGNPFLDVRVREALSLGINREAIIDRIQFGSGAPANQFAPEGIFGHNPDLPTPTYDPERARELLAEAGYEDGWSMTIHGPAGRYVNDTDVLLAVGQMWAQLGLDVEVESVPTNVYFGQATAREFSAFMVAFGITTGESSLALRNVLGSFDEDRGWGSNNRFRYSSPEFDAALGEAFEAFDDAEREAALQEAARIAAEDVAVIPLYWEGNNWAVRANYSFTPSPDGRSLMTNISLD
ncbi:ABC transporter substrate-binding protein [Roseicitreum antarcticum]|uniref:Peptide/nickel transport system substrate-binding protein n=1 Tax=Roseicitreum antarcticum TaxID=564137 RepID=A0A1H2VQM5_9RHOB|nr:ABC transporter substrate-binding protein [Roseicitreum antarcticum]SDW70722.1 peptide/nickel transport system substrate-binding protein [Roseicitreum antarcticum]